MGFPEMYAQEVFRELGKRKAKNTYLKFMLELERLHNEDVAKNDVGCAVSNDCSMNGCYRYYMCDFDNKNKF